MEEYKKLIPDEVKEFLLLKPRQQRFVYEYCNNGFNAVKAYVKAYDKILTEESHKDIKYMNNIKTCANQVLLSNILRKCIKAYNSYLLGQKTETLENEIFDRLYKRAFYNPDMFLDVEGYPKFTKWEDIPKEWRCVVDGIETKFYGKDADRKTIVLKLANKETALDKLAKYINMIKDNVAVEHSFNIPDTVKKKLEAVYNIKIESGDGK